MLPVRLTASLCPAGPAPKSRDRVARRARRRALCCGLAVLTGLAATPALAGNFAFVAAPQRDLNRIYRVDRITGEVGACQYGVKDDNTGVTLCYPAGEGAGKQEPGDYVLIASNHDKESAVFRVDQRTGQMSVCYVWKEQVICTPPNR